MNDVREELPTSRQVAFMAELHRIDPELGVWAEKALDSGQSLAGIGDRLLAALAVIVGGRK